MTVAYAFFRQFLLCILLLTSNFAHLSAGTPNTKPKSKDEVPKIEKYRNGVKKRESHCRKVPLVPFKSNAGCQWDGKLQEWYSNGKLYSEIHYSEGQLHGPYRLWYRNGNPMSERNYDKGLLQGTFTEWDDKGKKISELTFDAGKLASAQSGPKRKDAFGTDWYSREDAYCTMADVPESFFGQVSCKINRDLSRSQVYDKSGYKCFRGDFDGNGYKDYFILDFRISEDCVLLTRADTVLKILHTGVIYWDTHLYATTPLLEDDFGWPATPRDGIAQGGEGADYKIYLYDFDTEEFIYESYASEHE